MARMKRTSLILVLVAVAVAVAAVLAVSRTNLQGSVMESTPTPTIDGAMDDSEEVCEFSNDLLKCVTKLYPGTQRARCDKTCYGNIRRGCRCE